MDKNAIYRDEKFIEAYIQTEDKFEWYKEAFSEFVPGSFSWKWSWCACFFSYIQLIYRKCYLELLANLVIGMLINKLIASVLNISSKEDAIINLAASIIGRILFSILMGGVTPYLIYRRYVSKVNLALSKIDNYEEQLEILRKTGGVNKIGRNILIAIDVFLIFIMLYAIALLNRYY